jgi:hypothetical protein
MMPHNPISGSQGTDLVADALGGDLTLYAAEGDWPLPATTALRQSFPAAKAAMSTQERVSLPNWWLEFARRVIGQWLRKTKAFLALNLNIVCRPTQTSKAVISDDDPKALLHAFG